MENEGKAPKEVNHKKRFHTVLVILLVIVVAFASGGIGLLAGIYTSDRRTATELEAKTQMLEQYLISVQEQNTQLQAHIDALTEYVWDANTATNSANNMLMADMAERVAEGLDTDAQKAMAVAGWVAQRFYAGNYEYNPPNTVSQDVYGSFALRQGLCGDRALVAAQMMGYLNIPTRLISFYDFPDTQNDHVGLEAYYDGGWHYLDPTYGYFELEGGVLSLEQIMANPQDAIEGMVVFDGTEYTAPEDGNPEGRVALDREAEMRAKYTAENLANARSWGPALRTEELSVYPKVSMASLPLQIGQDDGDYQDVQTQGAESGLSKMLYTALNLPSMYQRLHTEWEFTDCEPGEIYYISYTLYSARGYDALPFYAEASGAQITLGQSYTTTESLHAGTPETWRIEFVPSSAECSVKIAYDFEEMAVGAYIDSIQIGLVA